MTSLVHENQETELGPIAYGELRRLAAGFLFHERQGHTLQPTALVHEVFLKLRGNRGGQDRAHFFAIAARIMRQILADHGRRHRSLKRGSGITTIPLDDLQIPGPQKRMLIYDLDEALTRLARFAPRPAKVVELRFFGGMTEEEIAIHLDVCSRTVKRDWIVAKAWLYGELSA